MSSHSDEAMAAEGAAERAVLLCLMATYNVRRNVWMIRKDTFKKVLGKPVYPEMGYSLVGKNVGVVGGASELVDRSLARRLQFFNLESLLIFKST